MSMDLAAGRLPLWRAAWVVARRDFVAILFSRSFIFFLLGPLFPILVGTLAAGVGTQAQSQLAAAAEVGVAMSAEDGARLVAARNELAEKIGPVVPRFAVIAPLGAGEEQAALLTGSDRHLAAIISGTLDEPVLTAPDGNLARWTGTVSLIAAMAAESEARAFPPVTIVPVATSGANQQSGRYQTARGGQVLLFLLIMLLAGMVLSNLVEEKGNKIIEVLAAAIPMDAVFVGKLFAMLAISVVGIALWITVGVSALAMGGRSLTELANPAVGWPLFLLLGGAYFGMGYLLLGSIFLAVGAMAGTVREVQTLSMPVTMSQVLVFFFASLALSHAGEPLELAAIAFPLSSPFAMLGRAAMDEALWPHALALLWQALCVAVFVKVGAGLFRRRVLKSGPQASRKRRGLFRQGSASEAQGERHD